MHRGWLPPPHGVRPRCLTSKTGFSSKCAPFIRGCWRYNFLQSLEEFAASQHHTPVTSNTTYANIRPNAVDKPFITATWVRLLHLYAVTHIDVSIHDQHLILNTILTIFASSML